MADMRTEVSIGNNQVAVTSSKTDYGYGESKSCFQIGWWDGDEWQWAQTDDIDELKKLHKAIGKVIEFNED